MSFRQFSVYLHEIQVLFIHFVVVVVAAVVAAALCMSSTYIYAYLDNQYVLCTFFSSNLGKKIIQTPGYRKILQIVEVKVNY